MRLCSALNAENARSGRYVRSGMGAPLRPPLAAIRELGDRAPQLATRLAAAERKLRAHAGVRKRDRGARRPRRRGLRFVAEPIVPRTVAHDDRLRPESREAVGGDTGEGRLGGRTADDDHLVGEGRGHAAERSGAGIEDQGRDVPRRVREYAGLGSADKAEPAHSPGIRARYLGELPGQPAGRVRGQRNAGGARLTTHGGGAKGIAAGQLGGERTRYDGRPMTGRGTAGPESAGPRAGSAGSSSQAPAAASTVASGPRRVVSSALP